MPAAKPKRKRSYKEQQEFETIEATLQKKEARRTELEQLLSDGTLFRTDAALARKHTEEVAWLSMEIEKLYARWQELEEMAAM